ncbi:GNAT family N-acetyltransferase [Bacillus paralicheniformis]|uniref:GNAT family N-acetyltransferase n=1 Tax=Bacillus paralicheniformis TaxID=1648923 RepID=UPI00290147AA|nr:GNAT family N-acetyltransferase [Bacillus paralicheniformis]MDU0416412.1 GNAT family N-acetyltransferase [Bacillus paralicheniformis]
MTIHIQQLDAPLKPEFVAELINLWNDNALETADCTLDDQDRQMIQQQLKQYVQSAYGAVFAVVNERQEAVGYGLASIKKDLVSDCLSGHIDEVYIAPVYRRNKLGKLVVDRMMDWFERHQVSHVQVSVDIDNQSALRFWEGIGFSSEFYLLTQ